MCIPKCNGGLGIKYLSHWNMVMVEKQVCNIDMKADNLWIK